jgi:phosphomannomutase
VPEQADPDPDFPTVKFPNPEEPGALDLALALARAVDADLLIANDPDGDRLAVAIPVGQGGWRALDGNQVGALLAEDLLAHGTGGPERLVATTIVSSRLLSRIAAAHGVGYGETLTGFKWIANLALARPDRRFVMGYEEALGYTVGDVVRDKDGLSAAQAFCDLAAWCKARGEAVRDRLAALYRQHGLHLTRQKSVTLPGAEGAGRIRAIMAGLRAAPPQEMGGVAVARLTDYREGTARELAGGAAAAIDLPRSDVLAFDLAGGGRVLARPSGTEPKIKFYFEVREPVAAGEALETAEARARLVLDRIEAAFVARAVGA